MCAQVIASGSVNAVASWFDLQLDAQESLTTGVYNHAHCILSDVYGALFCNVVVCCYMSRLPHMTARKKWPDIVHDTAPDSPQLIGAAPAGVGLGGILDSEVAAAGSSNAATPEATSGGRADPPHTAASGAYQSAGQNQESTDAVQQQTPTAGSAAAAAAPLSELRTAGELHGPDAFSARAAASHCMGTSGSAAHPPSSHQPVVGGATATALPTADSAAAQDPAQQPDNGLAACSSTDAGAEAGKPKQKHKPARHYWGQALQHLDRAAEVEAGSRLTLLAKRDGGTVRFSLRVGFSVELGPSADEPVQNMADLLYPCSSDLQHSKLL